jgi:hypothetical protein
LVESDPQSREVPFEEEAKESEVNRQELELEEEAIEESRAEEVEMDEVSDEEAEYARKLALDQEQAINATMDLRKEGQLFSGPSLFKYMMILLVFAIPNDIIDAVDFTGFLMPLSWFISLFLSVGTIFVTWFTDSELNRVKNHMSKVGEHKKALTKTMARTASGLTKFAPKNPLAKVIAGSVLEMIPIVSILPWSSICVFLAYRDEHKTYKEAREMSGDMGIASVEAIEMV